MSDDTLYRIYIGPGWISDPMDVVNDLIDEGVLVPVEPDKMWLCWSEPTSTWMRKRHEHSRPCNDRCGYVLIVEIGDTE